MVVYNIIIMNKVTSVEDKENINNNNNIINQNINQNKNIIKEYETNDEIAQAIYNCVRNDDYNELDKLVQINSELVDTFKNPLLQNTALLRAVYNGSVECVEILLKAGANVNHQNRYGMSALMLAAVNNQPQCINLLFQYNADAKLISKYGETALMLAAKHNNEECIDLLSNHSMEEIELLEEVLMGEEDNISFNVSEISDILSPSDIDKNENAYLSDLENLEFETRLVVSHEQLTTIKSDINRNFQQTQKQLSNQIDRILGDIHKAIKIQVNNVEEEIRNVTTKQVANLNVELNEMKQEKVALSQRLQRVESVTSLRDEEIITLKNEQKILLEQFNSVKSQLEAIKSTIPTNSLIPSSSSSSSPPLSSLNQNMLSKETLLEFLTRIHCQGYLENFISGGAINVNDLIGMPLEDLVNDVGMKKIEARRLLRLLPTVFSAQGAGLS